MEKKCKKCGTTENVNFDGMCKKCYEDSIVVHEVFEEPKEKKIFWKDKKNVAIVILSFILVCFLLSSNDTEVKELKGQLEKENAQITELNQQLEESNSQITILRGQKEKLQEENQKLQGNDTETAELKANNQTLQGEKEALEDQKNQLEKEKASLQTQNQELNAKVQELQSKASSKTAGQKPTSVTTTASTTTASSEPATDTNSATVYITDTGDKYHRGSCSYLKKSKHEISKSSAQAQGYTPCSRCNP